jgi:hypothetical protein
MVRRERTTVGIDTLMTLELAEAFHDISHCGGKKLRCPLTVIG